MGGDSPEDKIVGGLVDVGSYTVKKIVDRIFAPPAPRPGAAASSRDQAPDKPTAQAPVGDSVKTPPKLPEEDKVARLWVMKGNDPECMLELTKFPVVIGREQDCQIILREDQVSRHHAEIRRQNDKFWIKDLNSRNHIFVNGQQVAESRLRSGDRINLGPALLVFGFF